MGSTPGRPLLRLVPPEPRLRAPATRHRVCAQLSPPVTRETLALRANLAQPDMLNKRFSNVSHDVLRDKRQARSKLKGTHTSNINMCMSLYIITKLFFMCKLYVRS